MIGLRPNLHALLIGRHTSFQIKCPQSFNWNHFLHWMSWLMCSRMILLVFKILHCISFHQITMRGQLLLLILSFFLFWCLVSGYIGCLSYLYLVFSIECRSRKNLNSIFKFMNAEKSMLRSFIDGVELMVFTPNQLNKDSRGTIIVSCICFCLNIYLWHWFFYLDGVI